MKKIIILILSLLLLVSCGGKKEDKKENKKEENKKQVEKKESSGEEKPFYEGKNYYIEYQTTVDSGKDSDKIITLHKVWVDGKKSKYESYVNGDLIFGELVNEKGEVISWTNQKQAVKSIETQGTFKLALALLTNDAHSSFDGTKKVGEEEILGYKCSILEASAGKVSTKIWANKKLPAIMKFKLTTNLGDNKVVTTSEAKKLEKDAVKESDLKLPEDVKLQE